MRFKIFFSCLFLVCLEIIAQRDAGEVSSRDIVDDSRFGNDFVDGNVVGAPEEAIGPRFETSEETRRAKREANENSDPMLERSVETDENSIDEREKRSYVVDVKRSDSSVPEEEDDDDDDEEIRSNGKIYSYDDSNGDGAKYWSNERSSRDVRKRDGNDETMHVFLSGRRDYRDGPQIWDQWGKWSSCTVSCGAGKLSRWRHCIAGGCSLGEKEAQFKTCPAEPKVWDQWGKWSCCSASCGTGRMTRWRHCMAGGCASGEKEAQLRVCELKNCR